MLSLTAFTFAENSAEFNEEMGIDTNSHTTSSEVRTTRDIPAGGLLLIPDSGGDRVMAFILTQAIFTMQILSLRIRQTLPPYCCRSSSGRI